jgi:cobalt-zinc-cadmium efflux system outer membrane protein
MPRHVKRSVLGASALSLLMLSPALAQVGAGRSLTLSAAIERALAANPTIAAARLRGAIDVAGLAVARERPNPEATIEVEKETPKQAFGVVLPLELGGKRAKRIAVSEAAIHAGEAEIAAIIAQVRNDVRRAYYGVLVADARLTLMNEMRAIIVQVRDTAQQRFNAGDVPRLEVMQAALSLASAENEATAAQANAGAARAQLNALLGEPLETVAALTTAVESGEPLTIEAAMTLAHTASTDLVVLDRQIDAQRAKLALAHALRVPDVTSTATLTHDAEPEFTYGWRAGAAITLPLFTSHRAGVAIEQTTLDQLMAQRQATLARIDGAVTAAAITVQAQRQLYLRYRDDIVPQAQQVEQLAQDAYRLGQTGFATLLPSLQATRDVRLRALDAISQFQNTLADLERAIGAPLP